MFSKRWTICLLAAAAGARGQSGMDMADMNSAGMFLMDLASGTSANPAAWPTPMTIEALGKWNTMLMGTAFVSDIQQSGPRGGDKLYSTNAFMAAAGHRAGAKGAVQVVAMFSLEPLTVADRRYPLLFQTGETAYGKALVDAQHPHNFVMALGVQYAYELAPGTFFEAYLAPVGDPALGPVAYPHRASAAEIPQAPISHHWQDSTHISDDVATVGLAHGPWRIEASGFHGAEPGENRWTVQQGVLDSYAARLWFLPSRHWAAQISAGRLTHPEALEPGDQVRVTASLEYTRPMAGGSWSSSLVWGRTHNTATGHNLNAYLAESALPVSRRNLLTGRFELVDKDELFADQPGLAAQLDLAYGSTFRIAAYTVGYTRDIEISRRIETGIGANFSAYSLPQAIQPYYGQRPVGGNLFVRFRVNSKQ